MKEQTLVLLKPDCVQRGLIGQIISRFERCGLKIVAMKMKLADEQTAAQHYIADDAWCNAIGEKQRASYAKKGVSVTKTNSELGKDVQNKLITFLQKSPVIAMVLQGHDAIAHVRKLVGTTAPKDSAPGTIRGDFSFDTYTLSDAQNRPLYNIIHASSEESEAKREIAVWFSESEIHEWTRIDETILYDTYK